MTFLKYISMFFIFVFTSEFLIAVEYYVDSRNGNDSNSGQSISMPWKSISKVNSMNYLPGDRILFKRGETWEGTTLIIDNSGTTINRITYGAYGEGEKPILTLRMSVPGWNNSVNWIKAVGDTVWKMDFPYSWNTTQKIRRLWLNDIEYALSNGTSPTADNFDNVDGGPTTYGTNRVHRFTSQVSNNVLSLWVWTNGTNPALYYSGIKYSGLIHSNGTIEYFTIKMINADYITIEELDIRGGLYSAVGMKGSDYSVFENCVIGKHSQYIGIMASSGYINSSDITSDYGTVRNCVIDSDFKEKYYLTYSAGVGIQFGIATTNGASHWQIHNNVISRWAIGYLNGSGVNAPAKYNEFYNNEIFYQEGTYAKGAQDNGTAAYPATFTKIYGNNFHDVTMGINVCAKYIYIGYNIIERVRYSSNEHATSGNSGYGISIGPSGNSDEITPDSVFIYNNTFIATSREPIFSTKNNGWFENNLFINCSDVYSGHNFYMRSSSASRDKINNNLFYHTGATSDEKFLYWVPENISYNVAGINALPETNGDESNNNLQYLGAVTSLVNTTNLSLVSGSPAINSGIERIWMQKTDLKGNTINGIRDIGAIEYVVSQSSAPIISSSPLTTANTGEPYLYDVNATGNPAPSYRLTTNPSGMTINTSTGSIQWTTSAAGNFNVTVEAYNGITPAATQSFTITVTSTTGAPEINSTPVTFGLLNQLYTYDVNASGNPTPAYMLSVFPSGMTINSSTGVIQWTPTAAGSFDVTVKANNGVNPETSQSFIIKISDNVSIGPVGTVSYWKFDEASGSTYIDDIGNNDAIAIITPVPVTGQVSGAQKFTGTSKLNVAANSSFDFRASDNFSVEFWYNGSSAPSTVKSAIGRYIPEKNARWWVGLNASDGRARFYMSAGTESAVVYGSTITDGKWHHVAATRNASSGVLKLYVDGVLRSSATKHFTSDFSSASANLNIGWLSLMDAYTLTGNLDELAIHKTELTASDIQIHYNQGIAGKSYFTPAGTSYCVVNTKVFLEGPFSSGLMTTTLLTNSLLPLVQPYNIAPWNYAGSEMVTSIPADVVDWVLVELRTGTTSLTSLKKRAGFLKKDGSIVDLDGLSKLKFDGINSGNYYIVVKHRNHLDVMSAVSVSISSTSALYDFSTDALKAYGNSLVNLGNGQYGMISGDGDANGFINILDYGTVSIFLNQIGYLQGDLDMNKIIDTKDFERTGLGLFQSSKVPQ